MDGDERDSWELHFEDTLDGGKRLNDVAMARIMTEGAEDAMAYLMELGVPWSRLGSHPTRYPQGQWWVPLGKLVFLLQGLHKAVKRRK